MKHKAHNLDLSQFNMTKLLRWTWASNLHNKKQVWVQEKQKCSGGAW